MRAVTANGYTTAEEAPILDSEKEAEDRPFRPAAEVLADIAAAIDATAVGIPRQRRNGREGTLADFFAASPLRGLKLDARRPNGCSREDEL